VLRAIDAAVSPLPPAVVVRGLADAEAVLADAAGRPVLLLSPPEAARLLGPAWWAAMIAAACARHPAATAVLDCGDGAGLAQAALAEGVRGLVFSGAEGQAARLASIAAQAGVLLLRARPEALDMGAYGALRKLPLWLGQGG
jgi:hypothetical protein